jgi:hypothetical protein
MSEIDKIFEFKQFMYLGGQVTKKHPEFGMLASLDFQEAEQYQLLQFWNYLMDHPNATLEEVLEQAIIKIGRGKMLRRTKELTRLSMILGDIRKTKKYGTR